jgi:hypothetical protein
MSKRIHMYVTDVESVSIRDAGGADSMQPQIDVYLNTKDGEFAIRCIPRRGRMVRVNDFRKMDRKRSKKTALLQVPMKAVME